MFYVILMGVALKTLMMTRISMFGVYNWFSSLPQTEVKSSFTPAIPNPKEDKVGDAAKESLGPFTQNLTTLNVSLGEQHRIGKAKVDLRVQRFQTHLDDI